MQALDQEGAQFQQVQYELQRMLALSSNIPGLNVWKISTPDIESDFNAYAAETAGTSPSVLKCFHPITDHDALSNQSKMHQYIANLQSNGINFPQDGSGVQFVHGKLSDDTPTLSQKKQSDSDSEAEDEQEDEQEIDIETQKALVIDELKGGLSREDNESTEEGETKVETPLIATETTLPLPKIRAYLVVNVLTGRPGSFPTKEAEHIDALQLPNGYNSICYPAQSQVSSSSTEDHQIVAPYTATFRTFSSRSISPLYLVSFNRDGVEGGVKQLKCDMCEVNIAELYCRHEDANLCKDCDKEVHGNKLLAKHKRVPLRCSNDAETLAAGGDNTLEIFKSKCPFHTNMDVEFFCPKCDVPVCIYCKMVGSHSTGAFNNHRLVGVRVAWKKAIDEASEPNPALSELNKCLKDETSNIRKLRRSVDTNEKVQIADIRAKAERAIEIVRNHGIAKRAVLDSDSFSLKRRAREAENLESFLELQKKKLLPVEFITFWGVHKRTRDALTARPVHRPLALTEVFPDILVGEDEINVMTTAPYHPYEYDPEDNIIEEEMEEEENAEEEEEEEEENENVSAMFNAQSNRRHSLINKRRRETIIAFETEIDL